LDVPSIPELTPLPALGWPLAISGGQNWAQLSVHVDMLPVSFWNV
jgi:hypothetical protein